MSRPRSAGSTGCSTRAAARAHLVPGDRSRQGWKRQLRRMFGAVDAPIERLVRVRIGPVRLDGLRSAARSGRSRRPRCAVSRAAAAVRASVGRERPLEAPMILEVGVTPGVDRLGAGVPPGTQGGVVALGAAAIACPRPGPRTLGRDDPAGRRGIRRERRLRPAERRPGVAAARPAIVARRCSWPFVIAWLQRDSLDARDQRARQGGPRHPDRRLGRGRGCSADSRSGS